MTNKENKQQDRWAAFRWRLPAILTTLAVALMLALMPGRIRLFPEWFFYLLITAVLLPMVAVGIVANKTRWLHIERTVTLLFCLFCGISIIVGLAVVIREMLNHSAKLSGLRLLSSSIAIWATNVFIFTLAYWQIDRGGPQGRVSDTAVKPDWHFPAQDFSDEVLPDWRPTFVDYLFLGFSTSTAFSMTEATPLSHRAKFLMMIQSTLSLATIVVVGARAINILGS